MLPGPSIILSCPHCGGEKGVLSLFSGNTFGMDLWSDTRRFCPYLPEVSPIQQCPHCRKYYFLEEAHRKTDSKSYSHETGQLDFAGLKEAKRQFEESELSDGQKWTINYMLLLAFNDLFNREEKPENGPSDTDWLLIREVVQTLIDIVRDSSDQTIFHAELLRETGRFEEALQVLGNYSANAEEIGIVEAMKKHIAERDCKPFLLIGKGQSII